MKKCFVIKFSKVLDYKIIMQRLINFMGVNIIGGMEKKCLQIVNEKENGF